MLSCPSKTFIVGEYAVLDNHPAIVLAHTPYFQARIHDAKPFHPNSPAGAYLKNKAISVEFIDPHQGLGGFGGSSAEFLLAYCLVNQLTLPLTTEQAFAARRCFLDILAELKSAPASGIDIICQSQLPGIYFIDPKHEQITELPWPFANYQLTVEHTGFKIKTHDHLATTPQVDSAPLAEIVMQTKQALEQHSLEDFCQAISNYQRELQHQQLTHPNTLQLLESKSTALAIKGCGAFGADVLLRVIAL